MVPSVFIGVAAERVPPLFALLAMMLVGVVLVSLLLLRFRQSLLLGYFLCGVVIANSGVLHFFEGDDVEYPVRHMSDIGVVLLMFTVGLEFSLGEVRYLRRIAVWGGIVEMLVTATVVAFIGAACGLTWPAAIGLGVALATSSTALGVKVFQERGTVSSPGARLAFGIAIFQDIFVIAFVVLLPLIFSTGEANNQVLSAVMVLALKGLAFVAIAATLARWIIPRLLHSVARSRSRELFTLAVFGLCAGVAFLGGLMGFSLALGAFVAGVTVSESIYRHRILTDVRPLKDLFLTIFFVSVGLTVDVPSVLANAHLVVAVAFGLMLFKGGLVTLLGRTLGISLRASILGAASISSAGEFSLVVFQRVADWQPWPPIGEQVLISSIAISMALVPLAMRVAGTAGGWLEKRGWLGRPTKSLAGPKAGERMKSLKDHAIVCGYGPVGQQLVTAFDAHSVPVLVVELNADTVRAIHGTGRPVLFADASHAETWELAKARDARLVAFTFPEASVVAAAMPFVREQNAGIVVLARTKFGADTQRLNSLGVDLVIHDEAETARAVVREALGVYERTASS
jgi:CPA2 family monovalent cation:H+ antiporter-2